MAIAPRLTAALLTLALGLWAQPGAAQTVVPVITGLDRPYFLAVDGSDNLYVVAANGFQKFLAANGYKTGITLYTNMNNIGGMTVDRAGNVFVSDATNNFVAEMPASNGYTTVETIATGFVQPGWLAVDSADNVFVSDSNNAVKEIVAAGGYKIVKTLNSGFSDPFGLAVDADDNVFVASFDGTVQEITAADGYGTIKTLATGSIVPQDVAVDSSGNVFFSDTNNSSVTELPVATNYQPSVILSTSFGAPYGIAVDSSGNIFVADYLFGGVKEILSSTPSTLASVLPGARSVELGQTATVFASMINSGASALGGCSIALPATAPAGLTLGYQTTDPSSNTPTGTPNTPVTIPGNGGSQSFVVSFQSSQAVSAPDLPLVFGCTGAVPAAVIPGVDTVDLIFSATPVADIITAIETPTGGGIMDLPIGSNNAPGNGALAVASTNHGATAPITVSFNTGSAYLPIQGSLCQTDPATGQCLAAPTQTITLDYAAGAIETFTVFLQSVGPIAFQPASSRVFVQFTDAAGTIHGSVSVAVETVD